LISKEDTNTFLKSFPAKVEVIETTFAESKKIVLLKYPFLEGSHTPSLVGHFLSIKAQITVLHGANLVHGDIKLANLLFSFEDGKAIGFLIDMDLVGIHNKTRYIENYNPNIKDGKREHRAKSKKVMLKQNDLYSFGFLCSQFECKDKKQNAVWEKAWSLFYQDKWQTLKLKDNELDKTVEEFCSICSQISECEINKKNNSNLHIPKEKRGTGSHDLLSKRNKTTNSK